jgi:hypothetical protein
MHELFSDHLPYRFVVGSEVALVHLLGVMVHCHRAIPRMEIMPFRVDVIYSRAQAIRDRIADVAEISDYPIIPVAPSH